MAVTTYGVNDALAVKLWSKTLSAEALKATPIAPLIGEGTDNVIQLKSELDKGPGDRVTFGLRAQLSGDGVTEGEAQEGNEEALTTFSDNLYINELIHAVRNKNDGRTIDAKRVPFNLRSESMKGLRDWWAKRMSVSFFNQVCGYTAEARTKFTGMQATTAPSSGRRLACNATTTTADASISSGDKMKLIYLDYAKEIAQTAATPIRPIMVNGEEKYVVYLHPYQVTDLRTDAATAGNWFDIAKASLQGGAAAKSPIYSGALGEYNGMILRSAYDVANGVNAGTGAAITTVKRAVLLGAQAAVAGFVGDTDTGQFRWVEELFDYERELGVSVQGIWGLKKTVFNSTDFGTVVIASYAAAHA
jgi:N4-gp56 family major capsid protein